MKAIKIGNSKPVGEAVILHKAQATYRLNKYISDSGYASRREADRMIMAGRVTLNGDIAVVGQQVEKDMIVQVDGHTITHTVQKVYIALHKPVGITCTTDLAIEGNLVDYMDYGSMIFPIGRLDKDSSGLLLLTNDGDVVNKILREEYGHDKEYEVKVDRPINDNFIHQLEQGVSIYNPVAHQTQVTQKCTVIQTAAFKYRIILRQGLNRQIRRMAKALGYNVVGLKRLRIMNVELGHLPLGHWRYLTQDELVEMNRQIESALPSQ